MKKQYAIIENNAVVKVINGSTYNNLSFGINSTVQDRKDAGLYEYIVEEGTLLETQFFGNQVETIDDVNKTVTITKEILEISAAEILERAIAAWKDDRHTAVEGIEVTYNGVIYQGDEGSQTRMARAIISLPDDVATVNWVAKDNSITALTKPDLQAILLDAGTQQSTIWTAGRPA